MTSPQKNKLNKVHNKNEVKISCFQLKLNPLNRNLKSLKILVYKNKLKMAGYTAQM